MDNDLRKFELKQCKEHLKMVESFLPESFVKRGGNFSQIVSYPIVSYPILSYPILSYPILSYPILSYPILSCPVLSYPILSYPTPPHTTPLHSTAATLRHRMPSHAIPCHPVIYVLPIPSYLTLLYQILPLPELLYFIFSFALFLVLSLVLIIFFASYSHVILNFRRF